MKTKKQKQEVVTLSCIGLHISESDTVKKDEKSECMTSQGSGLKTVESFQELLPHIGEFGWFHVLVVIVLLYAKFTHVVIYMSQQFMVLTPKYYWCHIPELKNLTPEERLALAIPVKGLSDTGEIEYEKCVMYDRNYTALVAGIEDFNISAPIVSCRQGMEYNFTGFYTTITTEFNWVCQDDWKPNMAQSIYFVGSAFGTIVFSFLSDRFGRRTAHVVCTVWAAIFGVASAFSWDFISFVVFRTLVGFSYQISFATISVLAVEFVGTKYRAFVIFLPILVVLSPVSAALPWIAVAMNDWRTYTLILHAPLFLSLFVPLIIPDSARWKISRGKVKEVIEDVQYMASLNRKQLEPELIQQFEASVKKTHRDNPPKTYSTWNMATTPNVRRTLFLMCFIWGVQTIGFDAAIRNSENLGINPYIGYTLSSLTEIPSGLLSIFIAEYLGRIWSTCFSIILASIFVFLSVIFLADPVALPILAIMMRCFLNIGYNTVFQIQTEVFPTVVRSQGIGFTLVIGHFMTFLSPQILYLGKSYEYLPYIIVGVLYLMSAVTILFIPETAKQSLPETLEDGKIFGKDQSLFRLLPKKLKRLFQPTKKQFYLNNN